MKTFCLSCISILLACYPLIYSAPISFSYSAETWAKFEMDDYSPIANREAFLESALRQERLGRGGAAKSMKAMLVFAEESMNTLPDEKKAVLSRIWAKASGLNLFATMSFSVHTPGGELSHDITALTIHCAYGEGKEEQPHADAVVDDICTLEKMKRLSLKFATIEPESFKKLTRLKQLEYFDAPVNITDEILKMLLRELPSLKCIRLFGCNKISGAFALDKEAAKNLREITLIETGLEPNRLVDIITLPGVSFVALDGINIYVDGQNRDLWIKQKGDLQR